MKAIIRHKVGNDITAYIDGEKVLTCYITGYCSGKKTPKIEFATEDERLQKFVEYCEKKFNAKFEIITETKYHLRWVDGHEFDIYAESDEKALKKANSYLNTESGSVTQGDRFVGNILPKELPKFYIARKTWKRRDLTNPRM